MAKDMTAKIMKKVVIWEEWRVGLVLFLVIALVVALGVLVWQTGGDISSLRTWELLGVELGSEVWQTIWVELPRGKILVAAVAVVGIVWLFRKWPVIRKKMGYLIKFGK